jgi:hypothetical protein
MDRRASASWVKRSDLDEQGAAKGLQDCALLVGELAGLVVANQQPLVDVSPMRCTNSLPSDTASVSPTA